MLWSKRSAAVLLLSLGMLGGCRKPTAPMKTESHAVHGKVVSLDKSSSEIMLDHETIPGFMEAMTMPYRVDDPAVLGEVHPGDRISATILSERDDAGPKNLRLHDVVIVGQAKPDYLPPVVYHTPKVGDTVPDFKLLNQSGKTISLAQFRGKVVALTFIYTRCQLADYCPRMSRNFAEIDAALAKNPSVYAKTHLLSVSFDPKYDTPAVLRSYGGGVTGKYTKEDFAHWDFAAPPQSELLDVEKWFGVGVTPGNNNSLAHSLSTVIVGADGKVLAFYPSNDWQVKDALAVIESAAK
ncbi:SCO family protein [Granulicella cerasi]|uniref:SCO family protein n=1 Tax=Granulicella cerasi TaxID=741063 RepID=A0ABW1Z4Y8_9BACT|nr:SCO family protein [Granulicella cerasi]